jgi:hypothetical protein
MSLSLFMRLGLSVVDTFKYAGTNERTPKMYALYNNMGENRTV